MMIRRISTAVLLPPVMLQAVLCVPLVVMSSSTTNGIVTTTASIVQENESVPLQDDDSNQYEDRWLATKAEESYHYPEDYLDDDDYDYDEYHLGISGLGKGRGSSGKGSSSKGKSSKSSKSSSSTSSSYDNVFEHHGDDDDSCWCDYRLLRRRRTTRGTPRRGLGVGCVCPEKGDDDDDDDDGKGKGGKGGDGDDDDDDSTGKGKGGKGGKGSSSSSSSSDYDDDEYNYGGKGKGGGPSPSSPTRPPSSSTTKPPTRSPTRSPTKAPATKPSSPSSPDTKSPTRPPTRSPTRSPNLTPSGGGGGDNGGDNQPSTPTNGGGGGGSDPSTPTNGSGGSGGEPSATPPPNGPPSPSSTDNGGGGGGNSGDDDDDISRPTPTAGTPTSSPPSTPSTPTDSERDPPTNPPNGNGTPNGTPSSSLPPASSPPASAPSNGGGGGPSSPTNPPNRCTLSGSGLFGADVGFSEQFDFQYQTLVIPSVTVAELNLDMLGSVEEQMGEGIVERVFPQCSNDLDITESLAKSLAETDVLDEPGGGGGGQGQNGDSTTASQSSRVYDPDSQDEGPSVSSSSRISNSAYVMTFGNRRHLLAKSHHRSLQNSAVIPLDGFSSRPRDTVIEGLECDDVDQVFPCYVIQGRVTTYASTILNDATRQQIRIAIRQSIETGNLATADNRFLDVTWRDFNDDTGNGGGGGPVDAPSGTPSDGDGGSGPTDPDGVEIDRGGGSGGGLEPWAIALIAVGGVILLVMAFLCIRRPRRDRSPDEDEDDDGAESSSYDEASYESFSKSVEDQIKLHGGLNEENDEARAPLVAASALPIFTELDGPIQEESEGDYSIEVESQNEQVKYNPSASTAPPRNLTPDRQSGLADLEALSQAVDNKADFETPKSHEPLYVRDLPGANDESDSAYSSYEEVVEEEYEIDYTEEAEESTQSHQEDWQDEHYNEQGSSKSSFDEMRRKWEKGGR